jgi:hypothetical protein
MQSANAPLVGSSEQPYQALSMVDVTPATIVSRATTCQLFVAPMFDPKYPVVPCAQDVRPMIPKVVIATTESSAFVVASNFHRREATELLWSSASSTGAPDKTCTKAPPIGPAAPPVIAVRPLMVIAGEATDGEGGESDTQTRSEHRERRRVETRRVRCGAARDRGVSDLEHAHGRLLAVVMVCSW